MFYLVSDDGRVVAKVETGFDALSYSPNQWIESEEEVTLFEYRYDGTDFVEIPPTANVQTLIDGLQSQITALQLAVAELQNP